MGAEKVGDESANLGVCLGGKVVEPLEVFGVEVALIQRDLKLALDFRAGALRVAQKLDEFSVASTIETFRDVVHH